MTPLSPHFSLEELTFSELALRKGLINDPVLSAVDNLRRLALTLLEPARVLLGAPMHINSGYRSLAVNSMIGGATQSAHTFGRAADLVPIGVSLGEAFDHLRSSSTPAPLPFDQIIIECGAWIHIAIAADGVTPRREQLVASGSPGRWTYSPAPALSS